MIVYSLSKVVDGNKFDIRQQLWLIESNRLGGLCKLLLQTALKRKDSRLISNGSGTGDSSGISSISSICKCCGFE